MPRNVAHSPSINHNNRILKVGSSKLANYCFEEAQIKILNLGVKNFRNMMKEKRSDVGVFRLVPKTKFEAKCVIAKEISKYLNPRLREILKKFSNVFKEELPSLLPTEWAKNH